MEGISRPQAIGSRQYKSRRNRPCDFCRSRKVACSIEAQPPCGLCRSKGRQCTFVNGPGFRRRPVRPAQGENEDDDPLPRRQKDGDEALASPIGELSIPGFDFLLDADVIQQMLPNLSMEDSMKDTHDMFNLAELLPPFTQSRTGQDFTPNASASQQHYVEKPPPTPPRASGPQTRVSLEQQPGRSYRFVGPSGELDTYLISRRRPNSHLQSESLYTSTLYQYTRPVEANAQFQPPSVFTTTESSRLENSEPKLEVSSLENLRTKFNSIIRPSFARQLIRLFFRFIYPSFPILSLEQMPTTDEDVGRMPLSFLAAICASSLPFTIYDDELCIEEAEAPTSTEVFRVAWAALLLEYPDVRLSTIQASLLILQRQAHDSLFGEASFNWRLCATIVASCQTLGLNRDPTHWSAIELWEIKLRKRLWRAVFVAETWTAFGQGMPSHIHLEHSDVPLTETDDVSDGIGYANHKIDCSVTNQLYYLVSLTMILRDIVSTFFTVQAMGQTTGDLQLALNLAKPLRARLMRWNQELPPCLCLTRSADSIADPALGRRATDELMSSGSLRLAYVVAQLSLFRALLRPLAMAAITARDLSDEPSFWESGGASAVVLGAVGSTRELVNFIESLTAADWDSFWHSCMFVYTACRLRSGLKC